MEENARIEWDRRHTQGSHNSHTPDPFFVSAYEQFVAPNFKYVGRALDIAGGIGRHAVYLAERGWLVTLMDISDVAVKQARRHAEERDVHILAEQIDLTEAQLPRQHSIWSWFSSILSARCCRRSRTRSGPAAFSSTRLTPGNSSRWAAGRHILCTCWSRTNCRARFPSYGYCTMLRRSRTRRLPSLWRGRSSCRLAALRCSLFAFGSSLSLFASQSMATLCHLLS